MRIILLLLFLANFRLANTQEIISVEKSAKDMYVSSKQWIATNFNSANSVIQVDIPGEKLLVKGVKKTSIYSTINSKNIPIDYVFDVIITLDFKEGKCRINVQSSEAFPTLSPERVSAYVDSVIKVTPGGGTLGKKFREEMKLNTISIYKQKEDIVKKEIDSITSSLKTFIAKSDNW